MLFAVVDWTNVGMLFVTIVLAGITALYVMATFWLYRSQTDPDIVVFATDDEVEQTLIWIVVQKTGKSVATDITFRWVSPPMKAYGLTVEGAEPATPFIGPLVQGIRSLGPGSRRVFIWGQYGGIARALSSVPGGELSVVCQFTGGHPRLLGSRRTHRREFGIDLKSFDESITRDAPLRQIQRETEKIAQAVTKLVAIVTRAMSRPDDRPAP